MTSAADLSVCISQWDIIYYLKSEIKLLSIVKSDNYSTFN